MGNKNKTCDGNFQGLRILIFVAHLRGYFSQSFLILIPSASLHFGYRLRFAHKAELKLRNLLEKPPFGFAYLRINSNTIHKLQKEIKVMTNMVIFKIFEGVNIF